MNLRSRFYDFFGFEPAVWHSKITPKNKRIIWNGVINNNIKLVLGARSSLLLPFNNLGVIIVDEEHDNFLQTRRRCNISCERYGNSQSIF